MQWSKIKRKKGANDLARGQTYSLVSREIILAVKTGGASPELNPRLAVALRKARDMGVPKDKVESSIAKGTGSGDADNLSTVTYEGLGPMRTAGQPVAFVM